jgi:putative transposase
VVYGNRIFILVKTYRFRLKNKNIQHLERMAGAVNFVWNFCNDTAVKYVTHQTTPKWVTWYDLEKMCAGCCTELGILNDTLSSVCREYATRRKQFKKLRLSWRSKKRSLGWVPFKDGVKVEGDTITYRKIRFRFWESRQIPSRVRCGSFSQDAKGNWYVSLVCEPPKEDRINTGESVGIDLGLKTLATLSTGEILTRENITTKYAAQLATAQRAKKRKQVTNIQAKIRHTRKDWAHKTTTTLATKFDSIVIGDVSSSRMKKTRLVKSALDAGWGDFKTMLAYKAIALGVEYKEVKESYSTVTCSDCFERTGPSGLSGLGVREWVCSSCGSVHDRDVNAAKNILRFGHESPIKGATKVEVSISEKEAKKIVNQ